MQKFISVLPVFFLNSKRLHVLCRTLTFTRHTQLSGSAINHIKRSYDKFLKMLLSWISATHSEGNKTHKKKQKREGAKLSAGLFHDTCQSFYTWCKKQQTMTQLVSNVSADPTKKQSSTSRWHSRSSYTHLSKILRWFQFISFHVPACWLWWRSTTTHL